MLTQDEISQEALKRFAGQTRHKPQELADKFTLSMDDKSSPVIIEMKFGKRSHSFDVYAQDMELTLEEFSAKYLTKAAKALLEGKP